MKLEDTAPAEFLFGKVAENITLTSKSNPVIFGSPELITERRLNFTLFFSNFLYGLSLFFAFIIGGISGNFLLAIGFFIIISGILSAMKNVSFIKMYGRDLRADNSTSGLSFGIIQVYLNYAVAIILFSCAYLIALNYDGLQTPVSQIFLMAFGLYIYIRVIPDIGLASLCKGSSILNPPNGIKGFLKHYFDLSKVQGKEVVKLSFIRLSFLISAFFIFLYSPLSWLVVLTSIIFAYLSINFEKINASSAIMENRGEILSVKPSVLPTQIIDEEIAFSFAPDSSNNETGKINRSNFKMSHNKKSKQTSFISPLNNLKPFAVKTINKIAEGIRNEENTLRDINCYRCKKLVEYPSDFCYYCGFNLK